MNNSRHKIEDTNEDQAFKHKYLCIQTHKILDTKIYKTQTCKPGSVLHSVIDLGRMSPSASCSLPPVRMVPENRSGAGSPLPFGLTVYLALQPMRCTAACVATGTGGLLPRLFILITAYSRDGYFLLHYCRLSPAFPLGSMVPFVARTFLPV